MQLIYNNNNFDNLITGYTTANVEGRGILGRDLKTVDVPGRDGTMILTQKIPARRINVHYLMKAHTSVSFLYQINQLHNLLKSDHDVKFQFSDEEYYRFGRLSDAEAPPYDSLQGLGTFELLCQDPYKYKDINNLVGISHTVPGNSNYPYMLKLISVTFASNRTGLTIANNTTGRKIILTGAFSSGQILQILPDNITLNGQSIMGRLDFINSDWRKFEIFPGNQINTSVNATIALAERSL